MFCFAKFCRLCLNDSKDLIHINYKENDSEKIVEKMKFLLPKLTISMDGYPPWICSSCHRRVNRTYNLFQKWIKSQEILQMYLHKLTTNEVPNSTLLSIHLVNNSFKLDVIDQSVDLNVHVKIDNSDSQLIDNLLNETESTTNLEILNSEVKIENEEIYLQTSSNAPSETDNKIMEELLQIVNISDRIQHETELNICSNETNSNIQNEEKHYIPISDVYYTQNNNLQQTDIANNEELSSLNKQICTANYLEPIKNNYMPDLNEKFQTCINNKQYSDYYNVQQNYSNSFQCQSNPSLDELSKKFNNHSTHFDMEKKFENSALIQFDQKYDAIFNNVESDNSTVWSPVSGVQNYFNHKQSYIQNDSWNLYRQEIILENDTLDSDPPFYKTPYNYECRNNTTGINMEYSNRIADFHSIYSPTTSVTSFSPANTEDFSPTVKKDCFTFSEDSNEIPRKTFVKKRNLKENRYHQIFQDMEIASKHCNTPIEYSSVVENIQYLVDRSKSLYSCKTCNITYQSLPQILDHCSAMHSISQDLINNEYLSINEEIPEKSVKLIVNHNSKKFVCKKCDKNFSEFAALYRHVAVHVSNQRFFCTECGKSFPVYRYLSLHKLTHSRIKVYACKMCPKTFRGKDTLRTHEIVHHEGDQKPFICDICGKGFKIEQYLKIHMKRHNKETGRVCHICGKILKNEELCYKHIKEKHFQLKECEICHKTFHANRNLKAHMKLHGTKEFKCDQCDKEFFFKRDLENHHLLHTGFRPHICHYCGKDFRSLGALHKHIKIHTRIKAHVCQICQKGFSELKSLEVHERIHSGFKPHKCQECGKGYVKYDVLVKHMKKVHPELEGF